MNGRVKKPIRVGVIVACVCLAVPGVALALTGTYSGKAQGNTCGRHFVSPCTIHLRIVRNFVQRRGSYMLWHARCQHGGALTGDSILHGRLTRGRFHAHGSYIQRGYGRTSSGAPISARETVNVSFLAHRRKITGLLTATATVFSGSRVLDRCGTGLIHFAARR
jgi:hypothetical protein